MCVCVSVHLLFIGLSGLYEILYNCPPGSLALVIPLNRKCNDFFLCFALSAFIMLFVVTVSVDRSFKQVKASFSTFIESVNFIVISLLLLKRTILVLVVFT